MLGFTATASTKATGARERSVFECMKFNEATYWPKNVAVPFVDYSLRTVDGSCFRDLCRVIGHELDRRPVLLFCDQKEIDTVWSDITPAKEIKDRRDYGILKQLDRVNHKGMHELILATTEEEMRGVDLRAPMKGVTLVIAKSFSCQRNADQGLMRVGRYGDPCRKLIWEQTALINENEQAALHKKLIRFTQRSKPLVPAKEGPRADAEYYNKAVKKQEEKEAKLESKQQTLPFKVPQQ